MKNLKKVLAVVLAATFAFGTLTACGSSKEEAAPAEESAATEEAAPAETSGTIKFGTNPEFPPFEYVTSNGIIGEFDGIDMAIAVKIGEKLGMDVEMESMEFDSLLVALSQDQIDATIAGMTVTDERKKTVDFSTPYYTATQVMIVRDDSDIAKASDMEGKNISVVQGYTGEVCVQELGYDYTAFKKGTECVMELVNGKCDVVVIDSATAQKYVSDNEGLKIVEDPDAFEAEEYAIAVNKGNEELLNKINDAIQEMLDDGTISELAVKYTEADAE